MRGPPRNERIASHISVDLSSCPQPRDNGDDRDAEQDAPDHLGIADRRRYLVSQVWIAQRFGEHIDPLHRNADDGEAITPRHRQRVKAGGLDFGPHVTAPL